MRFRAGVTDSDWIPETLSSRSNVEETRNNLVEVLDNLEVAEKKIEGLEGRIDELVAANKELQHSLATAGDSGPALERVQELETMLDEKSTEMEETEEKYLEVRPPAFGGSSWSV